MLPRFVDSANSSSFIFSFFRSALPLGLLVLAASPGALFAQPRATESAATDLLEVAESPLAIVKTDSPRDTMRTFLAAMNDYRRGVETDDAELRLRIDDAVRTLNLEDTPFILREEKGREAAIFLKETIDRVIVIDYDLIPGVAEQPRWRLRKSPITISRVESGDRTGEYLFSQDTVYRAAEMYKAVADLPYLKAGGQGAHYRAPWFEQHIPLWMREEFLVMRWWQWIGIFLAILAGLILRLVIGRVLALVRFLTARSRMTWDDQLIGAVAAPAGYLAAVGLWFLSLLVLQLEGAVLSVGTVSLQILLGGILIWIVHAVTGVLSEYLTRLAAKTESSLDDQLVPLLTRTLRVFVVVIGVLIVIQNLGINVLSLLAGLGIGGLAFALAARDAVANFFGSLMILFDRPFQVGDWIKVGGSEGTVEEIGFRSTRIRTFYNSVISIPNSEVAGEQIDNMGARRYRRVVANISVTYDTPPEKLEAFMAGIKDIILLNPATRKDYFHVVFTEFGDSALVIMAYFFFEVPDWAEELAQRQNVYLAILRLAAELKVEFAFPTRTVHIDTFAGSPPDPDPPASAPKS